jgi:hypothetical protein
MRVGTRLLTLLMVSSMAFAAHGFFFAAPAVAATPRVLAIVSALTWRSTQSRRTT